MGADAPADVVDLLGSWFVVVVRGFSRSCWVVVSYGGGFLFNF